MVPRDLAPFFRAKKRTTSKFHLYPIMATKNRMVIKHSNYLTVSNIFGKFEKYRRTKKKERKDDRKHVFMKDKRNPDTYFAYAILKGSEQRKIGNKANDDITH